MKKIKDFETYVNYEIDKEKERLIKQMESFLTQISGIYLESFTNEKPFKGILKNMVVFTYSDHYRGNSGLWMEVGKLHQPHENYEDRGYIKGVITDLEGYLLLNLIKNTFLVQESDYVNCFWATKPRFKMCKNYEYYKAKIEAIEKRYTSEIIAFNAKCEKEINQFLKAYTGCSLLYYLRNL